MAESRLRTAIYVDKADGQTVLVGETLDHSIWHSVLRTLVAEDAKEKEVVDQHKGNEP